MLTQLQKITPTFLIKFASGAGEYTVQSAQCKADHLTKEMAEVSSSTFCKLTHVGHMSDFSVARL